MSGSLSGRKTETRVWLVALAVALACHAATLAGMRATRFFEARPVEAKPREPLELVFTQPPPPAPDTESGEPDFFSELPADRADIAPDQADALSNVDSRARDRADGGAESLPELQGQSEAPHVAMDPGAPGEPEPNTGEQQEQSDEQPAETPTEIQGEPESEEDMAASAEALGGLISREFQDQGADARDGLALNRRGEPNADGDRRTVPTDPYQDLLERRGGSATPEVMQRPQGVQDIFQEEMSNPGGNAALFGDVTLNTLEWAYAPWLQRFRRDFVRNWHAPYAYYLGLIDGWTLVELEISHDGQLLRLEMLDELGHDSLSRQSVASFKATAPFADLPAGFPEETLILRIKLIYPPLRRR